MSRQMHINVNTLDAGVFGGSWRCLGTDPLASFGIDHYLRVARRAEAACLEAVLLADTPVLPDDNQYRPGNSLEPTIVLAAIARGTKHSGLTGTLREHPGLPRPGLFSAARPAGSLVPAGPAGRGARGARS